jgi:hypothetical protein
MLLRQCTPVLAPPLTERRLVSGVHDDLLPVKAHRTMMRHLRSLGIAFRMLSSTGEA